MLSFNDILPSKKLGGDNKYKPFNQSNKPSNISINTETDTNIEESKQIFNSPKKDNLITPFNHNKYPSKSSFGKSFNYESNKHNGFNDSIKKPFNKSYNKYDSNKINSSKHYNKPFDKHNKDQLEPVNITQEELFTPITKIDKLNAPILEQPRQIDSRVTPIREIIYEVPRVENRYIIANDNPYQNINRLNFLYEDFIPDPLMPDKILTINDRFNLGEFISNNVLSLFEKDTDKYYLGKAEQQIIKSLYTNEIDGLSKIFSKIKSLRLNPNFEGNNNMPKDFMIFKSCYPIRKTDSNVTCSKLSQSVNLRIYKTPFNTEFKKIGDISYYEIKEIPKNSHIDNELNYYMQINNIIKNKESPNFPICYGIVKNIYDKTINFEPQKPAELKISDSDDKYDIQMKNMTETAKSAYDYLYDYIINKHPEVDKSDIEDKTKKLKDAIEDNFKNYQSIYSFSTNKDYISRFKNYKVNQMKAYLNQLFKTFNFRDFDYWRNTKKVPIDETISILDSNSEIVKINKSELDYVITFSLCESPDWSYKEWTNPQTIRQYGVAKMIESGWHTDEEKEIFTFQLLYALLIMLKHQIFIPKFSIDNIFIKKIITKEMQTKIFVYEIDGIKYYIPNKGFYVMIDQRYATIDINKDKQYYDKDNKYENNISINNDKYVPNIISMIQTIFNDILNNNSIICQNVLKSIITDKLKIPDDINNINKCINLIRNLIIYCFMKYSNNRNGTIISADEFRLVNGNIKPLINYDCGELVLESVDNNTRYRIAQIVSLPDNSNDKVMIQTVDNSNNKVIIEKPIIELFSVKNNSFFRQIKDKYIRSDDNIIETYSISTI